MASLSGAAAFLGVAVAAVSAIRVRQKSKPSPLEGVNLKAALGVVSTRASDAGGGWTPVAASDEAAAVEDARVDRMESADDVVTYDVPHVQEWPYFGEGDSGSGPFRNPLMGKQWTGTSLFVGENEAIVTPTMLNTHRGAPPPVRRRFLVAGPYERVRWRPSEVRAAIVTCGGLCPGLNTVIRELVMCLAYSYGVRKIWGVPNGFRGTYENAYIELLPRTVSSIHMRGGTVLGTSRGGFNVDKILAGLERYGINQLYVIGGDGSHRGALSIFKGAIENKVKLAVVAVPKTIDNDIPIIDKSFGFDTAVEQAVRPINCAHTEALAAHNGIGIVKLMGRHAGFIAVNASLAARDVNVCLIPEEPFSCRLLCEHLVTRLKSSNHAVIVIAEGAQISRTDMQECGAIDAAASAAKPPKTDESGNPVLDDVGAFLRTYIAWYFKRIGVETNIKYIDPTYMIRSVPANASDSLLCSDLAFAAVHGAFAGYTGFTVGQVAGQTVWIPISAVAQSRTCRVSTKSRLYARLLGSTGQPSYAPAAAESPADALGDLLDWARP
uniref:Phosphofructokinase domain-containing protein n=1 Tax=Bicosoecida sp. CB-2014 TaxID=1486930 RepID=A0A7S1CPR1_9STRA|mmetsp:Transcript_6825/g.24277  ORF Transcript_6825/g.24277 Transcript_6825/m.24277 type:complete len:552 (+) Transcript_6825:188-1843(+)